MFMELFARSIYRESSLGDVCQTHSNEDTPALASP